MAVVKVLMDLVRVLLTVTRPFSFSVLDTIYRIIYGGRASLPPIDDDLLMLPATQLARMIRHKEATAEDVMKAFIKRVQAVEPFVNACVDQRFSEALKEARGVDLFLSTTNKSTEELEQNTPLLGVPFSCKEAIGVKGLTQMCGIYAAKDRKAPEDAETTALYRKAGAIPVVVTNVPELCSWWDSENTAFGRTVNPYDNIRGVGGSSGGEAAIIAYAGAVFGIGNDLAGSIRLPCAFNGIYGHKPSPGMISNVGYWPAGEEEEEEENPHMKKFVGTGPMCRFAQDLPLLAQILSEERINFSTKVDFRKMKIYYMEEFPGFLLKSIPQIRAAVRKAAKYFEETYDNQPVSIKIEELGYALEIWESKLLDAGLPSFRNAIAGSGQQINLFSEVLKAVWGRSEHTLQAIYYAKIERRAKDSNYRKYIAMFDKLKTKLERLLEDGGLLIVPTHPEPAPHHFLTIPKYPNMAYTCIFNILGNPSTQIPAGVCNGLPIGIQVISAIGKDFVTITAAGELEKVFGGWKDPGTVAS